MNGLRQNKYFNFILVKCRDQRLVILSFFLGYIFIAYHNNIILYSFTECVRFLLLSCPIFCFRFFVSYFVDQFLFALAKRKKISIPSQIHLNIKKLDHFSVGYN